MLKKKKTAIRLSDRLLRHTVVLLLFAATLSCTVPVFPLFPDSPLSLTVHGAEASEESMFEYALLGNQAVIARYKGESENVVVPDKLEGEPVTAIGEKAFRNCTHVSSVTLPDTLKSIGSSAFSNCTALSSIRIPDGVTVIEKTTFYNCSSLSDVSIPDGVTEIRTSAFGNCSSLEEIVLPEGLKIIANSVFENCTKLASMTLPGSLTAVGYFRFQSCGSLKEVRYTGTEEQFQSISLFSDVREQLLPLLKYETKESSQTGEVSDIKESSQTGEVSDIKESSQTGEASDIKESSRTEKETDLIHYASELSPEEQNHAIAVGIGILVLALIGLLAAILI